MHTSLTTGVEGEHAAGSLLHDHRPRVLFSEKQICLQLLCYYKTTQKLKTMVVVTARALAHGAYESDKVTRAQSYCQSDDNIFVRLLMILTLDRYNRVEIYATAVRKTISYSKTEASMPYKVERGWRYWTDHGGDGYFIVFTNGKGSCKKRTYNAADGLRIDNEKSIKNMDYQIAYRDLLQSSIPVRLRKPVNLEKLCKDRLPRHVLDELRRQIPKTNNEAGKVD